MEGPGKQGDFGTTKAKWVPLRMLASLWQRPTGAPPRAPRGPQRPGVRGSTGGRVVLTPSDTQ